METRIFFNPGDSIANIHDYNEAVRKGQIFKKERKIDDLVIAKGPDDEEYAIFYAKDALPADHAKAQPYDVKEHLWPNKKRRVSKLIRRFLLNSHD